MMPLITHFKATSIWRAFFLNSLVGSFVIVLTITIKSSFDRHYNKDEKLYYKTSIKSILFTFIISFLAYFMSFIFMHFLTGFGSGMLAIS